jgi:hypothetical protein
MNAFSINQKFIGLFVLLMSSFAQGGIYTYKIYSLDLDQGIQGCNQYLAQAVKQFEAETKVSILSAQCNVDTTMDRMNGSIVYSAPKQIEIWSTESTNYGEHLDFYSSREQCETALADELVTMKRLTGLNPFLAFCHKTSSLGTPQYRSRMDAVGASSVKRFESDATTYHPLINLSEIIENLDQQARDLGLTPTAWYQGHTLTHMALMVSHYETVGKLERYRLLGKPSLYYKTLEQCQTAAKVFNETRTIDWTGVTACSQAHPSVGFQFNLIWWDRAIAPDFVVNSTPIPAQFATLEECISASRTLYQELNKNGEPIVGILCGRDTNPKGPFQIEIISKLKGV